MITFKNRIGLFIVTVGLLLGAFMSYLTFGTGVFGAATTLRDDNRNVVGYSCSVSTVTRVAVGDDLTTAVLASSTNRLWARIQLVQTAAGVATSSVFVHYSESAATTNNGMELSTTTPFLEFGLKTDNPYTGPVNAITPVASTTVLVTECVF